MIPLVPSTLLYAVTNATNYVPLNTAERVRWACASEAERRVHEEFVFTKLTANGRSIFADRWFEWSQRDIRLFVGKLVYRGYKTRLRRVVKALPHLVQLRQRATRINGSGSLVHPHANVGRRDVAAATAEQAAVAASRCTIGTTPAFKLTLLALQKTKLWERGATVRDVKGNAPSPGSDFVSLDGKPLNPALLGAMDEGRRRLAVYYRIFYLDTQHAVERPAKAASFALIPALSSEIASAATNERTRTRSQDSADIEALMTVPDIKAELELRSRNANWDWPKPKPQGPKAVLAVLLATARKAQADDDDDDDAGSDDDGEGGGGAPTGASDKKWNVDGLCSAPRWKLERQLVVFDTSAVLGLPSERGGLAGGGDGGEEEEEEEEEQRESCDLIFSSQSFSQSQVG